jgi:hypothetical protein
LGFFELQSEQIDPFSLLSLLIKFYFNRQ